MASFTIDFDLRKSVHNPSNPADDYILRPTLQLVDGNTEGALSGIVSGIVNDNGCTDNVDYVGRAECKYLSLLAKFLVQINTALRKRICILKRRRRQ